jgi:hypothetical protein
VAVHLWSQRNAELLLARYPHSSPDVPPIAENTSIGFGSLFAAAILGITAGRMSLITVL